MKRRKITLLILAGENYAAEALLDAIIARKIIRCRSRCNLPAWILTPFNAITNVIAAASELMAAYSTIGDYFLYL